MITIFMLNETSKAQNGHNSSIIVRNCQAFGNMVSGTLVKQADVILMGYPLEVPMPENVRLNDLNIYERVG